MKVYMNSFVILWLLAGILLLCAQPSGGFWFWGKTKDKVDGNWSQWSSWSSCQNVAGKNTFPFRFKNRTCSNPAPENGGENCKGQARRNAPCVSCNSPLGMESKRLQDFQITASSFHNEFPPSKGRLNGESAWCAADIDKEVYFRIDFKALTMVSAVATQAFYPDEKTLSLRQGRVSKYLMSYSDDGITWAVFENRDGKKVLSGNKAKQGTVLNILEPNFAARYVRIHPSSFFSFICLKVELYGCRFKCGGYLPHTPGDLLAESSELENVDCLWQAALSNSKKINLDFLNFNLPCESGSVEVRGGGPSYGGASVLGHYCGHDSTPPPIRGNSNKLWVRFQSNVSDPSVGFYAVYFPSCGGHLTNNSGIIKSPNYPQEYYHNSRCTWILTVAKGKAVMLKFVNFDIEGDRINSHCSNDQVAIWDGRSSSNHLIGRYCNTKRPQAYICSTGNNMRIKFKADDALAFSGFLASYHAVEPNSSCTEPSSSVLMPSPTVSLTIFATAPINYTTGVMVPKATVLSSSSIFSKNITAGGLPPLGGRNDGHGNTDLAGKKKNDDKDDALTTTIIISVFSFIVLCMIIASVTPSIIHRCEKRRQERESTMQAAVEIGMKKNDRNDEYEMQPLTIRGEKDAADGIVIVDEETALTEGAGNLSDDDQSTGEIPAYIPANTVVVAEDKNDNGNIPVCMDIPLEEGIYGGSGNVCISSTEELGCDLEYDTTDLSLDESYEDLGSSFATEMAAMMSKFESTNPDITASQLGECIQTESDAEKNYINDVNDVGNLSREGESSKQDLQRNMKSEDGETQSGQHSFNSQNASAANSDCDLADGINLDNKLVKDASYDKECDKKKNERDQFTNAEIMENVNGKNEKLQKALSDLKATLSQINSESGSISDIGKSKTNSLVSFDPSLQEQDIFNPPPVEITDAPIWEIQPSHPNKRRPKLDDMDNHSTDKDSHIKPDSNKDSGCSSSSECECLPATDEYNNCPERSAETCV